MLLFTKLLLNNCTQAILVNSVQNFGEFRLEYKTFPLRWKM